MSRLNSSNNWKFQRKPELYDRITEPALDLKPSKCRLYIFTPAVQPNDQVVS